MILYCRHEGVFKIISLKVRGRGARCSQNESLYLPVYDRIGIHDHTFMFTCLTNLFYFINARIFNMALLKQRFFLGSNSLKKIIKNNIWKSKTKMVEKQILDSTKKIEASKIK